MAQEVAAFVTLRRRDGELRGCIGRVEVSQPLYRTVQDCVISAATSDYRFSHVTADELDEIRIEISALSPFRQIEDPEEIQIGQHGAADPQRSPCRPAVAPGGQRPELEPRRVSAGHLPQGRASLR